MKFIYYLALSISLIAGLNACQEKSNKKKGAAATQPDPTPPPTTSTPVVPQPTPPSSIAGTTCTSGGLMGGEAKTLVVDTAAGRMQISSSSGQQDYTIQDQSKKAFFAPKSPRYEVIPSSGQSAGGYIVIEQDTKTLIGRDRGYSKIWVVDVPYSFGDKTTLKFVEFGCK